MRTRILAIAALGIAAFAAASPAFAVNPQPLPPRHRVFHAALDASGAALNPQPLPPRDHPRVHRAALA
jgi:hypothetical protein